jgi:hypothetical protein
MPVWCKVIIGCVGAIFALRILAGIVILIAGSPDRPNARYRPYYQRAPN